MAYVVLDVAKLRSNYEYLDNLFTKNHIHWSVVTKLLCGHRVYLKELLNLGISQVCDSRVSNLRMVKKLKPDIETVYIKPPASKNIQGIVKYADISMNSTIETIQLLSQEAARQDKVHKVIIMIELGELREGIMGEDLMAFYGKIFELQNIEVIGIGANLSCLYGVLPNHDKLIQLSLYKQLIEVTFKRKIPFVSGGSSVTIPLILQHLLPRGVNHFRVGETLFLGTDVYHNTTMENLHSDVFRLYAQIIELMEKPRVPMGEMGSNVDGQTFEFDENMLGQTSCRAILDLGLLDVDEGHIQPVDESIHFVGASSDMLVINLGENKEKYKVGDMLEFRMDYMGVLRILNSKYIDKLVKPEA